MALEKTNKQKEIYWGGIDNTTIPTMKNLAEAKKVTTELSRQEEITQRLLNIDDLINDAKKIAAKGTAADVKKYKELKKEKKALMKEEAEHAKIMAKEEGKKYTLKSLQADLEEKIGDMLKEEVGWTTKLSSNLYTQGVAQKSFLMDRLQIVNTGQSIYDWGVKLTNVLENGTENQKKWAQAMTPMVSMGGKMIDDAISLGASYDNIGSGTFMDMTKSMDEQLKKAERYKDYVKKEIIPALKADQEQLEETLKTQKKGSKEWKETKKQIEENKQEQKESNALAKENVDNAKNLSAEAKRQKVIHGQTASTVAFIAEPFEKMKTAIESTKVGKFVSELVGIGDATEEFTTTLTNYVRDSLDPDNPMNFGLAMSKMWTQTDKNGRVTRGQFQIMFDKFGEGFEKLKGVFGGINQAMGGMLGPALAIVAILMIAKKVAEMFFGGMMDTRKELGVTVAEAGKLQSSINTTAMEFSLLGVSAEDVAGISDSIRNNMGGLSSVTHENLSAMTQLTALYGISGENTGILAAQMMAVGASSVDAATSQMESVALLARANGVAPAAVMNDVAESADAFAGFAKEGGQNVFKAAIAARKLGLDMAAVENIADSLLDFESSINAQMEASMLLGRNINTDKARELALAGDLEGMQKEVTKQIGSAADFEKLNVVQRKSLAAAFGVSVSELGKMVANQDKLNNMTEAEKGHRDAMAKVMEFLGKAWTGFLSVGKALLPIVVGLGVALAAAFWQVTLAAAVVTAIGMGFNYLNKKVPMLGTVLGVILGLMTAIWMKSKLASAEMSGGMIEGAKNMAKGLKERLMGGGDKGKSVVEKVKKPKGGDKVGGPMESMFGKKSKISFKKMLKGAAAMLVVAVAMFVMAKALQEFGKVTWESIAMAGVTLLGLTLILAIIGKLQGQLIQGALAMLIMSVGLIPFAFALQMLSSVDYGKVALAGVTLIALTAAMFLLGALLAGPGAIIFGAGVIGMIALGGALIILGVGLMSVGQGMKIIGSIVEPLKQLASIVAPLFKLSTAFAALGYSMGVMALGALTLLPALPVLMTLAALGMMGGAVLGIGGKGAAAVGGEEVSPVELKLDSTNAKLDTLIGLMGKEGVMAQNLQGIKRNTGGFIDQIATA